MKMKRSLLQQKDTILKSLEYIIEKIPIEEKLYESVRQELSNLESFIRRELNSSKSQHNETVDTDWKNLNDTFNTLSSFISKECLYRQPDLTLKKLAEKAVIKERVISRAVNSIAGIGFKEFINKFRIDESLKFLQDTNRSVKEIQYEVGFRSKTTFYEAFQKQTKLKPREFRKDIRTNHSFFT